MSCATWRSVPNAIELALGIGFAEGRLHVFADFAGDSRSDCSSDQQDHCIG